MKRGSLLLEVGRYLPDPRDPEGRLRRMESYLAALSRELEELSVAEDDALRDIGTRLDALETATATASASDASEPSEGGESV